LGRKKMVVSRSNRDGSRPVKVEGRGESLIRQQYIDKTRGGKEKSRLQYGTIYTNVKLLKEKDSVRIHDICFASWGRKNS